MLSLENVESGTTCRIVWLLGQIGTYLHDMFHLNEDDIVEVVMNHDDVIIVKAGTHRYVMDPETAHAVKVIAA